MTAHRRDLAPGPTSPSPFSAPHARSAGRARRIVIDGCAVATVDAAGTEYGGGHVVIEDGVIVAVGPGPVPDVYRSGAEIVDGHGCLATPGLVNTHHHLYQWATQGCGQDAELFDWLTGLYPIWARLDEGIAYDAALGGTGGSPCPTVSEPRTRRPVNI